MSDKKIWATRSVSIKKEPKMSDKKIWIELPKVENVEQAKIYCDLANQMLEKLGVTPGPFRPVETQRYTKENTFYNCSFGRAAGFKELEERGTWFDLEYLARTDSQ